MYGGLTFFTLLGCDFFEFLLFQSFSLCSILYRETPVVTATDQATPTDLLVVTSEHIKIIVIISPGSSCTAGLAPILV